MDADMGIELELDGIFLHNGTYNYDSDYTFEDELEPKGAAAVLVPLLFSIVLALGVPGNVLVILFLALKRQCWSTSEIFILHLGLSDVLLLVTLPFWAAQIAQPLGWCCGLFWCRINGALFNISFFSGMLLLAVIAAERYLSIARSVQLFTQRTPRLAHITCLLVWLVSVLLSVPDWVSLMYTEETNMNGEKVCSCIANSYRSNWHGPSRIIHHVTCLLSVLALVVFLYLILMQLQQSTKAREKLRAMMLLFTLALVFFLCWTPYNLVLVVDTWKGSSKEERTALVATLALACVHACLRPLAYFALCEKFQAKTLAAATCRKQECKGDLWELGVGSENMPDQCSNPEEMKQMHNSEEPQSQSGQC